jgi:hypothetical protein
MKCFNCSGTEKPMMLVGYKKWICIPCFNQFSVCEDCGDLFKAKEYEDVCPRCQQKETKGYIV